MKDATAPSSPISHEERVVALARAYAEAFHDGNASRADEALAELRQLFPPRDPFPGAVTVTLDEGRRVGYLISERGATVDLDEVFRQPVDAVLLRSVSGNIYLIAQAPQPPHPFQLINGSSGAQHAFPEKFPAGYHVAIGSPFSGEIVKDGKPAIRLTSAITEAVIVRSLAASDIRNRATLASTILEEFGALRRATEHDAIIPGNAVAVSQGALLGRIISRGSLVRLFADEAFDEAVGPITHVYVRTTSNNIYRFEKDAPEPGYVRIVDMRASTSSGRISERILPIDELLTTEFSTDAPCSFGPVSTSPLREIVAVNTNNLLTAREIMVFSEGEESGIVDQFNQEIRSAIRRASAAAGTLGEVTGQRKA